MSDRMTGVSSPSGSGYQLWGRVSRAEAIEAFRKFYRAQMEEAAIALAWKDDELVVETYLGPWARAKREVVNE